MWKLMLVMVTPLGASMGLKVEINFSKEVLVFLVIITSPITAKKKQASAKNSKKKIIIHVFV